LVRSYSYALLQQSPDGASEYPDKGQTIMVLEVTSPLTGFS